MLYGIRGMCMCMLVIDVSSDSKTIEKDWK